MPQVLHSLDLWQKTGQSPMLASVGMADIDDAKATTTTRATAEQKRIVCEDARSNKSEGLVLGRQLALIH
ncbi:hypothetical protein BDR05DRAFT_991617 [Suillus weaverae]|nr:hypothetical protein BDR05DRAFT_991617 [Suillus weaverae]